MTQLTMDNIFDEMIGMVMAYNENNCCAPIAVAITTLTPFNKVYDYIMARGDRKVGKSTSHDDLESAIEHFTGKPLVKKNVEDVFGRKTIPVSKIGEYLPKGSYICYVRGHVLSVVDGKVLDWSDGRRHRVKYFYEIEEP